jgi:F-box protein 11
MDINIIEGIIMDNRGRISCVAVYSGIVMINNCQISLAYLTTHTNVIIPAVYCENCHIFIDSVWIKGNRELLTVGVLANNANIKVMNSKIINHRSGGFMATVGENQNITLYKCLLEENTGCGVLVKGNAVTVLEDCLVSKNQGVGIKLVDCYKMTVIGNKIMENLLNGIELVNCDGLVMLNNFFKNKGVGAILESQSGSSFYARLIKNTFLENYQHGIVIKGDSNYAKIINNEKIALNFLSGIHVSEKASPRIAENKIYQNLNQGIVVVTDSHAEIENNEIYENIKANVAFGGRLAEKTVITKNKIYGSRNEGVFVIEADGGSITNNEIYDNNDGVIIVKCKNTLINDNNVYNNIRCGVLISDQSHPIMHKNIIHDNQFLGLFIRDKSTGDFEDNELKSNISQLYLSQNCSRLLKPLKAKNVIEGRVDVHSSCSIF